MGSGIILDEAVASVIYDAVGIRLKDLPIASEEILRLIKEREARENKQT